MKNYFRGSSRERLDRLSIKRENGCIDYSGFKNFDGYGRFRYNGKLYLAHRAAYEIAFGKIPDGQHVLHRCDNPSCVNSDHLFLGTHTDNMRDMSAKGRGKSLKAENHPKAKLDAVRAFEIKWQVAAGSRQHWKIAQDYGVTRALVSMIGRNEFWRQECHD